MKHVAYFLSTDKFSFIMDTQLVPMWLRSINKQKTLLVEFFASRIDTKQECQLLNRNNQFAFLTEYYQRLSFILEFLNTSRLMYNSI
jgi:hypothetical protein